MLHPNTTPFGLAFSRPPTVQDIRYTKGKPTHVGCLSQLHPSAPIRLNLMPPQFVTRLPRFGTAGLVVVGYDRKYNPYTWISPSD